MGSSSRGNKRNTNVSQMPPGWKPPTQGVTGTMPGWTGAQGYSANANLPSNPNQFRAQTGRQVPPASYSQRGSGQGISQVIIPQRGGANVNNLRASSQSKPGGLVNLVAGPYTGNTPEEQFTGQRPTVIYNQAPGSTPARNTNQSEGWRNLLGLNQGVSYQTQMPMFNGALQPFTGNKFLRNVQYQPPSKYALGARGDNGAEDRALLKSQQGGPWATPYGSVYYSVPQTDYLNQNPQIGATGVFDDTLKFRGTATTTDLYDPRTLRGRRAEAEKKSTPVADRSYDAVENVRLNRGAPSDNLSEEMPAYTGYGSSGGGYGGGGYGGYGGGGGGGGYPATPTKRWLNSMASWRV